MIPKHIIARIKLIGNPITIRVGKEYQHDTDIKTMVQVMPINEFRVETCGLYVFTRTYGVIKAVRHFKLYDYNTNEFIYGTK